MSQRFRLALSSGLYTLLGLMALAAGYFLLSAVGVRAPERTVDTADLATLGRTVSLYDDQIKLAAAGEVSGLLQVQRAFAALDAEVTPLLAQSSDAPLRQNAAFEECLIFMGRYLQENRPLMADDAALRAALPRLLISLQDVRIATDKLLAAGFEVLALQDAAWRARQTRNLVALALLVFGALLVVVAMSLILRQQNRAIHQSSRINRQANQRLTATINASMDAVIVADMKGLILDYNGSAEQIFGYQKSEVLGLNLSEIIIPPHLRTAHKAGLKRYRETGKGKLVGQGTVAITAIRKDGSEFPVELLLARGEAQEGPIMIAYIRDMTEAKAAEAALQEARDAALAADQAKSRFLAIMSHEMRTPLTGIFGALDLIQKSKLTKKQDQYLDLAQTSAQTLLRHVTDVLDISRIDSGQLTLKADVLGLPDLLKELEQTHGPVAQDAGNRILTLTEGLSHPFVIGDAHRLRQVLLNLLTNALKFTEDGLVTLRVAETEVLNDKSRYRFQVEDTGAGIPLEHQPHIFKEFYTQDQSYSRTNDGTGLGLSIVRRLVALMGGEVAFTSEPGKGARFWFDLVLPHSAAPTKPAPRARVKPEATKGRRVLLVEDNATSRLVVGALLRDMGLEVVEAENGAEAVTTAFDQPLDLIFMDISMPVMDGLEATAKIKAGDGPNRTTPIVALTAHALASEQQAFLDAGMVQCLIKPVDPKTLATTLTSLLPGHGTAHLDAAVLGDLRTTLGEATFARTVQSFLNEAEQAFQTMAAAQDAGDLQTLQREAHKTLGAAGLLGAQELKSKLRAVEQAAKGGIVAAVLPAFDQARQSWQHVEADLRLRV